MPNIPLNLICERCKRPADQIDLIWVDDAIVKMCPNCRPMSPIVNSEDLPPPPSNDR